MPWEDHYKFFKINPTGLPSHILLLSKLKKLDLKMERLPQKLGTLLEARQMNDPVSLAQIRELVNDNDRIKKIEDALQDLTRLVLAGRSLPIQLGNDTRLADTRFDFLTTKMG